MTGEDNLEMSAGVIGTVPVTKDLDVCVVQSVGQKGTATQLYVQKKNDEGKDANLALNIMRENAPGSDSGEGGTSITGNIPIDENTDASINRGVSEDGDTTRFSVKRDITDDSSTYTDFDVGEGTKKLTSGLERRIDDTTVIRSETGSTIGGESTEQSRRFGVTKRILEDLEVDVSYERGDISQASGDVIRDAVGVTMTYNNKKGFWNDLKADFRVDHGDDDIRQFYVRNDLEYRFNSDLRLVSVLESSFTEGQDLSNDTIAMFDEFSIGVAYRPVKHDRLNLLAKYVHLNDKPSDLNADSYDPSTVISDIFAGEFIYELNDQFELVEKGAFRLMREKVAYYPFRRSETALWVNRLNYQPSLLWGVGAEYRALLQRQTKSCRSGMLLETFFDIGSDVRLAVGYNFTDFEDDLTKRDYGAEGFYFRVSGTFSSWEEAPDDAEDENIDDK